MPAKKLGKREAKKMLTNLFDEIHKCKGKKCAEKFLLGSGELAERLADDDTTGGNAKQFFSGVGKGLLGLGYEGGATELPRSCARLKTGGVTVAGSKGGVRVAGSRGGVRVAGCKGGGKDSKAGKIAGKILSFGLGKKPTKSKSKSKGDKRTDRGKIVAAVMKEKGMNLPQASHFVKVNNLA
jgi:hypothetical protein